MKPIQIGKLIFNKKAISLLTLCLFLNGVIIGAVVAYKQLDNGTLNPIILLLLLFTPYIIFIKKIGKNVQEID